MKNTDTNFEHAIEKAYSELKATCGGVKYDYFGLVYLEQEYGVDRERAIVQIAFGGNDYGVDGFHFDAEKQNFYLFQFKYSKSPRDFKGSFERLIQAGMERIFGARNQDQQQNQLLVQLKSCLNENKALIHQVCIYFVFMGDPAEAERSKVLETLREDLENKKYLIDGFFGRRDVTLLIEFRSVRTRKVGAISHAFRTRTYRVNMDETISRLGPNGEKMTIGFVPIVDLYGIYQDMGQRFFERNIRAALRADKDVNRSIQKALRRIVIDGADSPQIFAFNHNGVTLYAEALSKADGQFHLTEPRLLNGAQTVATFTRFLTDNQGNKRLEEQQGVLGSIYVPCRIITDANYEFVTSVTINNNRQNPVEPWNLRANDKIQLELQDKFRDELGIYYGRQERAFENLSDEELEEQGITQYRAIELTRLTRTFLVADGELEKLSRFRDVFENDKIYEKVFSDGRLKVDARHIVLCYKVQFRLRRLAKAIEEKGPNKYAYVDRARNLLWALLCQAILNDQNIEEQAERFGRSLSIEAQYTDWLSDLAIQRCRFLLSDLVADKTYAVKAAEGNFSFMRTNAAYKRCMQSAYRRWKWVEKRLK
jgi:hypothetical protein